MASEARGERLGSCGASCWDGRVDSRRPRCWRASAPLGSPSVGVPAAFLTAPTDPWYPLAVRALLALPAAFDSHVLSPALPASLGQQVKAVLVSGGGSISPRPELFWLPSSGLNDINSADSHSPVLKQNFYQVLAMHLPLALSPLQIILHLSSPT